MNRIISIAHYLNCSAMGILLGLGQVHLAGVMLWISIALIFLAPREARE